MQFLTSIEAHSWLLLAGFVLSFAVVIFGKSIADLLFSPKPNGHPAANVFRLIAYMFCWIFAPIIFAVIAIAFMMGFVASL